MTDGGHVQHMVTLGFPDHTSQYNSPSRPSMARVGMDDVSLNMAPKSAGVSVAVAVSFG